MRNLPFSTKEFYHIYNRGVDKRNIITDAKDLHRFLTGLKQLNTPEVLGNLSRKRETSTKNLVNIVAYCINQNHFHFILEQCEEKGIEKFMHKLSMGYAKYFNTKYKRSGALFQGKFKAKHIDTDEYLLHLSAYINLNHIAHGRGHSVSTLARTSWDEYVGHKGADMCKPEIILEQFKNRADYQKFAEGSLREIIKRKVSLEELIESGVELVNT